MLLRNFLIFTVVMFTGGLIFMFLEAGKAKDTLSPKNELNKLKKKLIIALNSSEQHIDQLFFNIEQAIRINGVKEPYNWDYYESCFYVGSLVTTIGYGHIAPRTYAGQIFTIIYSLIGIPITMLVVRNLSTKITNAVAKIVNFFFKARYGVEQLSLRTRNQFSSPHSKCESKSEWKLPHVSRKKDACKFSSSSTKAKIACIIVLAMLVVVFLILSAVLRIVSEGWTFHESMYFWFITLTTVGFGDYVPYEGRKPKSLALTLVYYTGTFYLLIGLALIASLIQSISVLLEGRLPTVAPEEDGEMIGIRDTKNVDEAQEENCTDTSEMSGKYISLAVKESSPTLMGMFLVNSVPLKGQVYEHDNAV